MRPEARHLNTYACRLDDRPVEASIGPDALVVDGRPLSYLDMDEVHVDGWSVRLVMAGHGDSVPSQIVLGQLGRGRDDFLHDLRAARAPVRRAALVQWAGDRPIDSYEARNVDDPLTIVLFPDGLTVEPHEGTPTSIPLGLVRTVRRDNYAITFELRGLPPVTVRQLGPRTDEFLADLDRARAELAERTAQAYAAMDPALAGLDTPDGWAVSAAEAGRVWGALRAAVAGQSRAAEVEVLEQAAGDRLRLGIKALAGGEPLPFALAPVGTRVAVEGTDTNARATYVFEADPDRVNTVDAGVDRINTVDAGVDRINTVDAGVDRINTVLMLVNFRREALYLPEDQLGRWAVAVRVLEVVREARAALVARVVHDEQWEANLRKALETG